MTFKAFYCILTYYEYKISHSKALNILILSYIAKYTNMHQNAVVVNSVEPLILERVQYTS